jgi:hypothetical protein
MKIYIALAFASVVSAATCDSVAVKSPSVKILSAQVVAVGEFVPPTGPKVAIFKATPEFCRVRGVIAPSADSHVEF